MKNIVNLEKINSIDVKKLINHKEFAPLVIVSSLIPYIFLHLNAFQIIYDFTLFGHNIVFEYAKPFVIVIIYVCSLLLNYFAVGYSLMLVKSYDEHVTFKKYLSTLQWKTNISYLIKVGLATLLSFLGYFIFIIPGVLLSLAFILVPFIAIDDQKLNLMQTFRLSAMLMKNNYQEVLELIVSLIPNELLSAVTFKLYDFHYIPLKFLSFSQLYLKLRNL